MSGMVSNLDQTKALFNDSLTPCEGSRQQVFDMALGYILIKKEEYMLVYKPLR